MSAIPEGAKVVVHGWQPSELTYNTVEREFRRLARQLCGQAVNGFSTPFAVRENSWTNELVNLSWHRDSYGGEVCIWVLLWTNRLPTEVLLRDHSILPAQDGDVILLENEHVLHRTPPGNQENHRRWFARAMIPKSL